MRNQVRKGLIVATAPVLAAATGIEALSWWSGDNVLAACATTVRVVILTSLAIWLLSNQAKTIAEH